MRSRHSHPFSVAAIALVLTAALTACSSDDDGSVEVTVEDTTTTTVRAEVVTDGRLVIGALLPLSDTLLGEPMEAAIETAIDRINAAGGVLDRRVTLVVADEGSSSATAVASIQTLLDRDVDAIIGPASSLDRAQHARRDGDGRQGGVLADRERAGPR